MFLRPIPIPLFLCWLISPLWVPLRWPTRCASRDWWTPFCLLLLGCCPPGTNRLLFWAPHVLAPSVPAPLRPVCLRAHICLTLPGPLLCVWAGRPWALAFFPPEPSPRHQIQEQLLAHLPKGTSTSAQQSAVGVLSAVVGRVSPLSSASPAQRSSPPTASPGAASSVRKEGAMRGLNPYSPLLAADVTIIKESCGIMDCASGPPLANSVPAGTAACPGAGNCAGGAV